MVRHSMWPSEMELRQGARLQGVHKVAHAAHNEEGGGGVQAGADFVQEQRVLGAHNHLTCNGWHTCIKDNW